MKSSNTFLLFLMSVVYALVSWVSYGTKDKGAFVVSFFDVGQGDSILIKTPNNKFVLVDGGPDYAVDRHLYKKMGLTCNLEGVVLTHPHADHVRGLLRVLQRCNVKNFYMSGAKYDSLVYKELTEQIQQTPTDLVIVKKGDQFEVDNVVFDVLWPPEDFIDDNLNNHSVVLDVSYGNDNVLLTGDIENSVSGFVDWKDRYLFNAPEVVKVPHQGASDAFIVDLYSNLEPGAVLVISVGNNNYGHPSNEVVRYFDQTGLKYYRTDITGSVEFIFDQ